MTKQDLIKMITLIAKSEYLNNYTKSRLFGELYISMQWDSEAGDWLSSEHFDEIKKFINKLADENGFDLMK